MVIVVLHMVERENDGDSGITRERDRERMTIIVVSHIEERKNDSDGGVAHEGEGDCDVTHERERQ